MRRTVSTCSEEKAGTSCSSPSSSPNCGQDISITFSITLCSSLQVGVSAAR